MSSAPVKPLIVPELFSGVGSWEDWIDHFESAAAVNKWEDADKLLWLRTRMTGDRTSTKIVQEPARYS